MCLQSNMIIVFFNKLPIESRDADFAHDIDLSSIVSDHVQGYEDAHE